MNELSKAVQKLNEKLGSLPDIQGHKRLSVTFHMTLCFDRYRQNSLDM